MVEILSLAALAVAALVVVGFVMMIGVVLKFAFKIAFLPLAIIGTILGLIAMVVLIPVGIVILPIAAVLFAGLICVAIICTICWVGFTALTAIF